MLEDLFWYKRLFLVQFGMNEKFDLITSFS